MSKKTNECNVELDDRCQDQNGEIRRKRSDTFVETLRETYEPGFASGTRSDVKLGTLLERNDGVEPRTNINPALFHIDN
jgi:hypothetical protein